MHYRDKIHIAIQQGLINNKVPGVHFINILHADSCPEGNRMGKCNCGPEVTVRTERGVATINNDGTISYSTEQ